MSPAAISPQISVLCELDGSGSTGALPVFGGAGAELVGGIRRAGLGGELGGGWRDGANSVADSTANLVAVAPSHSTVGRCPCLVARSTVTHWRASDWEWMVAFSTL